MKKIGNGWQVNVYEYNKNTVYKKPHKGISAYTSIIKDYPLILLTPHKMFLWMKDLQEKQKNSLAYISQRIELAEITAHPVIEMGGAYYQDKVIPLKEYIKNISLESFKILVNDFADFTFKLYQKGIIDKSFNFTKNFGVNKNNKIVLIDIGELFWKEKQIEDQIRKKPWSRPQFLLSLSRDQRKYFLNTMDNKFLNRLSHR